MPNRCEDCGELIDWSNPNIHYAGHVCTTAKIEVKAKPKTKAEIDREKFDKTEGLYLCLRHINALIESVKRDDITRDCLVAELDSIQDRLTKCV